MKRILSHWTVPYPNVTRGLLRETFDDPIARVHSIAGHDTLHITRVSGKVFYASCPVTEARDIDAAAFRGRIGQRVAWIDGPMHRVDSHRTADGLLTVNLTLRHTKYADDLAHDAIAHATSTGAALVIALSEVPSERTAFVQSAIGKLVDLLPVVRDARGDVACGRPPRYHAIIADGSVTRAAAIHGCRAALFDDMDAGDGEEISRMCATGIFCALACSAADPHMAVAVRWCRNLGLNIVVWNIHKNVIIT